MRRNTQISLIAYGLFVVAGAASFSLPSDLIIDGASAQSSDDVITLTGVVRDFQSTHTDFDATLGEAAGQYSGLMGTTLGPDGLPVYDGSGNRVLTSARDASGNYIAPVLANAGLNAGVNFNITNGRVVPTEIYALRMTVIGASMENPTAQLNVTTRLRIGSSTTFDPFGLYTSPTAGNVHDSKNPRNYVHPTLLAANTPVTVLGRSHAYYNGSWTTFYSVDSNTNSTWVKVLRNGSSLPNGYPFNNQTSLQTYLHEYIDPVTQKVTIASNQSILLFELATTDPASPYVDFQDLVVLLTMAKTTQAFAAPEVPTCGPTTDVKATTNPLAETGAITSASTFSQWFNDVPGVNMSGTTSLDLVQSGGSYVFDDMTDPHYSELGGFYPADGRMFGGTGHNTDFTFSFETEFTYGASPQEFFEVTTDAEVWVFINGKLAIDLGGFHGAMEQRIDLNRLCLNAGQTYTLQFFMANRYAPNARLRLETNMALTGSQSQPTVFAPSD